MGKLASGRESDVFISIDQMVSLIINFLDIFLFDSDEVAIAQNVDVQRILKRLCHEIGLNELSDFISLSDEFIAVVSLLHRDMQLP